MGERYTGVLGIFWETGTEGVCWVVEVDSEQRDEQKLLYGTMATVEHGDRLRITRPDGSVVFDGVVRADFAEGWQEYPRNPGHGQPAALGRWIHWTQYGWKAKDWALLFFKEHPRAELIKSTDEERSTALRPIPPPGYENEDWE